ncbi:MAG: hypothetical protein M5U12_08895 [Verrucomicrobia bacterium]|nr:hypothetical protein [Verrucomicrobiota bacterium]
MISVIFTLDYEIYGNGQGSLEELALEPTRRLAEIFKEFAVPLVVFAEAIELAKIKETQSDPAISAIEQQLRSLRAAGHEIALHLHPWWANAHYEKGTWHLDWTERNLCALPAARIEEVVAGAVSYLRCALADPLYTPHSYRGGLWLMQPTQNMARVLSRHGIRVDSSVFKGGRTRALGLDYRPALRNGSDWRFSSDVNVPDNGGPLWEIPIYTEMVPFWRMLGRKRLRIQRKMPEAANGAPLPRRWLDFLRFRYPQKLDFCRMTLPELARMVDLVRQEDRRTPEVFKPVVSIGHSKDLVDFDTITTFLDWLRKRSISVITLGALTRDHFPLFRATPPHPETDGASRAAPAMASS